MKIVFSKQDPAAVLDHLTQNFGGPTLQSMVSFAVQDNHHLEVTISKAGTSFLSFSFQETKKEIVWELRRQKIAFAHLPFKTTIFERLKAAVERQGGKVVDEA